jgi:predicted deacylase
MTFMRLQSREILGDGPGPHLLITGGVHGDEFEPMAAIRRLMTGVNPAELCGRVTLAPVVNEGAFLRGQRVAEDGLDLARTCPGKAEGSVTERVAHALSELIRAADFYIDLHTGGTALAVWPMAGYVLHPEAAVLEQQRRMARAFNLPVVWGTDPRLEGRSLSVARDAKVPAIYAEYLGGGRCWPAGVDAYFDGCLNVMAALGMLARATTPSLVQIEVEDSRPNSGHMQRCYPAPADGYFEAVVELGQEVDVGDKLGAVVSVLGDVRQDVFAQEAGRVLVLRTMPGVRQGDSLAVILPCSMPVVPTAKSSGPPRTD